LPRSNKDALQKKTNLKNSGRIEDALSLMLKS
jgi:hypothetical protein